MSAHPRWAAAAGLGATITAALALLSIAAVAGVLAWEWSITEGRLADAGHPPLSLFLLMAALFLVPGISTLGLLLAWLANRAGSRLPRTVTGVHLAALFLAVAGWITAIGYGVR